MSPEAEITNEQLAEVYVWMRKQKQGSRIRTGPGMSVHSINGEPFVIRWEVGLKEKDLFCSNKHAQALEEAGIVSFSETKEPAR